MNKLLFEKIVEKALLEDIGFQDITTDSIITPEQTAYAEFLAKEEGVLAGIEVAETAFRLLDQEMNFTALVQDGEQIFPGQVIATVKGSARALLSAERTALNFLQHLSGIATSAHKAVKLVENYSCQIVDTRKTAPGLRMLAKYAVKTGGASNHRFGLFDAVLIKDNHITAAGGITQAVAAVRKNTGHTVKIEVETEDLEQVKEALEAKADIIMLDNMSLDLMSEAVKLIDKRALTEASGGITLDYLPQVAATGVDLISLGWLTHSVKALDISLNIKK